MKYVDTNVLVRVITGDDHQLATRAIAEIEKSAQKELCILDVVLVELCFVLEFLNYKMTRADIAAALDILMKAPQFFVSDATHDALKLYKNHPELDYTDCLLSVLGGKAGVLTFDKALQPHLS